MSRYLPPNKSLLKPKTMKKVVNCLFLALCLLGCSKDHIQEPPISKIQQNEAVKAKMHLADAVTFVQPNFEETSMPALSRADLEKYNIVRKKREMTLQRNAEKRRVAVVEIHPTGIAPNDWINIQTILDAAGARGVDFEMRLKSTDINGIPKSFNLGNGTWPDGRSLFIRGQESHGHYGKVSIVGEKVDGHITTITGGRFISRGAPNLFETWAVITWDRPEIKIKGIKFDGGSISTAGGGGQAVPDDLSFEHCHFINNRGLRTIGSFGTENSFLLRNCKFEEVRIPLQIFNNNPDVIIEDNVIINSTEGFIIGNNASGNYKIRDNNISILPILPGEIPYWEAGIVTIVTQNTTVDISNNKLDVVGPGKIGVFVLGFEGKNGNADPISGISIYDNKINVQTEIFAAIDITALILGITDVCIFENQITGVAGFAFSAYSGSGSDQEISNVTFADNNIKNFTSSCLGVDETFSPVGCADILLGSHTNSVEYCGDTERIIINKGTNNSFSMEDECIACT